MVELADETANYTVARLTRRVPETLAGLRLDKALARMFPEHSRNRLQRWLKDGHVSLDSRSEEHTSELQSRSDLVCRLLLEKKKKRMTHIRAPAAQPSVTETPPNGVGCSPITSSTGSWSQ